MDEMDSMLSESAHQLQKRSSSSGGVGGSSSHGKQKPKVRKHYIQLCVNVTSKSMTSSTQMATQGPLVRCQSEDMAHKLARIVRVNYEDYRVYCCDISGVCLLSLQINYAKGMYDEREQTLSFSEVGQDGV